MLILGIESSCDDTSIALLKCSSQGCFVINEKTASQIDIHKKYGGVVPEIAGRMHAEKIVPLIEEVLKQTSPNTLLKRRGALMKPDVIAVSSGPGLITGLIVAVEAARTLSYAWKIPIVAVNHIEGHMHSVLIGKNKINYPALSLVASGGHTELILMKEKLKYKILGSTKDDAAGECFDKVAKILGLDYPGGPKVSKLAETGNPKATDLPRPMLNQKNFDFSFSGLKTACLYYLQKNPKINKNNFCASFEQAIIDVLTEKTLRAIRKYNPDTFILGGGVSANRKLRKTLEETIKKYPRNIKILLPEPKYSMDNGAMIAVAGYHHALKKDFTPWQKLEAKPNWKIAK